MRLNRKHLMTFILGSALAVAQTTNPNPSPAPANTPAGNTGATQEATPRSGSSTMKTDAHGQGSHSADHGMSSNKGAGTMVGQQDQAFMVKAAQGGLMEIEAVRLAQEKASSNEIKEFARKLEQDHTKANEQLKQLAAQKNVDLPTDMGKHQAMVDKIRNLSGDQFDKAFMKMQVQHHKKDVSEFQKQTNRSMDSDVKSFASATLPTLQEHLRQAEQLQGSTRGRKADSNMNSNTNSNSGSSSNSTSRAASSTGTTNSGDPSNANDSTSRPQGSNNPTTTK